MESTCDLLTAWAQAAVGGGVRRQAYQPSTPSLPKTETNAIRLYPDDVLALDWVVVSPEEMQREGGG